MAEFLQNRLKVLDGQANKQVYDLLKAILIDIDSLRQQINTHVHGGITAGAANTAVPTTTVATNNVVTAAAAGQTLNVSA